MVTCICEQCPQDICTDFFWLPLHTILLSVGPFVVSDQTVIKIKSRKPLNDRAWLARSQIKAFHLIVSLWRRRLICDTERLKGFKLVIMTSLCAHSLWFCLRNWIELKDWIVHETVSWNFVMPSTTYSKWQSPHETFLHSVTFRQVFVNLLLKLWEAIWMVIVKYYSTSL